jgi:hypothetical protein
VPFQQYKLYITVKAWNPSVRPSHLVSPKLCVVKNGKYKTRSSWKDNPGKGFEVLTAVVIKCFWGTCRFHLQGWWISQARNQHETGSKQRVVIVTGGGGLFFGGGGANMQRLFTWRCIFDRPTFIQHWVSWSCCVESSSKAGVYYIWIFHTCSR